MGLCRIAQSFAIQREPSSCPAEDTRTIINLPLYTKEEGAEWLTFVVASMVLVVRTTCNTVVDLAHDRKSLTPDQEHYKLGSHHFALV